MLISSLSPKSQTSNLAVKRRTTPSPRLLFNKHYLPLKVTGPSRPRRRRSPVLVPLALPGSKLVPQSERSPMCLYKLLNLHTDHSIPQRLTPIQAFNSPKRETLRRLSTSPSKPLSPWKHSFYDSALSPT